ncbi:uncharacterized protein FPRO_13553 [Fusarium proliferatum ET1]|uniref:Uncharacterized protein n=1 Tax=Fusarium proliferatum (strain ET1) TaxID=1227346 RepID=A0A1L7W623_FUSPR|nr:uncharacterized protein FPRO_13553 [Fusarium proliferatum ET1]CZR47886.1 uncharacterized protein FPRO_13553 [Fusarium proliferatum ET1]
MPSNIPEQATTPAKAKPRSAASRHRNSRFSVKIGPAKLLERQIIWFANGFPGNKLPERLEAAAQKAKLQQPNWERHADRGGEWPLQWDMNEGDALSGAIAQALNAPLRDGVAIEWLGQTKGIIIEDLNRDNED